MLAISRLSTALPVKKSCDIRQSVSKVSHYFNLRPGSHSKRLGHGRGMDDIVLTDTAIVTEASDNKNLCDGEVRPVSSGRLQANDQSDESEREKLKTEAELPKVPVGSPFHSRTDVHRTAKKRFMPSWFAVSVFQYTLLCLVHFRNNIMTIAGPRIL